MQDLSQLESDLVEAAKARDQIKLSVLRLLKSALKNYEIEVGHDASPQEILTILQKEAKKRKESIDQYKQADRADLVAEEEQELKILQAYLPAELSTEEIAVVVKEAIVKTNASSLADTGKVIAEVIKQTGGAVSGAVVSEQVKATLAQDEAK